MARYRGLYKLMVCALVFVVPVASAENDEDIDKVIEDVSKVTEELRRSPIVQHGLGIQYLEGKGVPQDYAEAAKWFLKAAEQDFPLAQFNLGLMYVGGIGVPQD